MSTVTERGFCDHHEMSLHTATGRSLPDDFWWALGQHFGLATPLLDWTESPYVAAYFAFADVIKREGGEDESRVVWGLSREAVEEKNGELGPSGDRLEIFSPLRGENARLVNQRGLFSRVPIGHTVEEWVRKHFKGEMSSVILFSIVIPNGDSHRGSVLRVLNRMNANALSLFPDLDGASVYCNMDLAIEHY